jgi:spermidine synthase
MSVLAGHHHRHIVVQDLDGQVVTLLAKELLAFLADHDTGPMVRVDDVVAGLERALDGADLVIGLRVLNV